MVETPISSREHREQFTKNYKQLISVDRISYVADLLLACLKPLGPMIVNGKKYETGEDVILKGGILRRAWEEMLTAINKHQDGCDYDVSPFLHGLLSEFDSAYVEFEKEYVGFLIGVEASCRSVLVEGTALVAKIDNGCAEAQEDFVALLQELNSVANIVGKGRQDLDYSIYAGAKKVFEAGRLPVMCGRVLDVYERAARYFEKLSEPDALDRVHGWTLL